MPVELSDRRTYEGIATSNDWLCAECGFARGEHKGSIFARPGSTHELSDFKRKTYGFVGMLRIHNEARWIKEVIESILPLCEKIFILDDKSTDDTIKICRSFGCDRVKVFESPFLGLNESRDKNWLYDRIILECAPDWILCIDGDEVLEKNGSEAIRRACSMPDAPNAFGLKIEFLWNDPQTVRADRIYGDFWRPSLFRPQHENPAVPDSQTLLKEFRFMSTPFGRIQNDDKPNLHCSSVPQRLLHGFRNCPARLKHYGYMLREWRIGKLDYYTSIDWKNAAEDGYRHMTQGDDPKIEELPKVRELAARGILDATDLDHIINVPASGRFIHAGPMELKAWSDEWSMSDWARQRNAA